MLQRSLEEALGGLSAGIVGTVIGFPLDTLKTKLQTQKTQISVLETARQLVQEGPLHVYRGVLPPLISLSILNTFTFTFYASAQDFLDAPRQEWSPRHSLAGGLCGPVCAIVSTPENLVKTQLQTQSVYSSSLDCARILWRDNGIKSLYTGYSVNAIREMAFLSVYFGTYEGLRSSELAIPVAGGCAGAWAWFLSFPLDAVRALVQGQPINKSIRAWVVWNDLVKTKGLAGFYNGVTPSILRAFIVSGTRFSAYEGALWLLRGGRES